MVVRSVEALMVCVNVKGTWFEYMDVSDGVSKMVMVVVDVGTAKTFQQNGYAPVSARSDWTAVAEQKGCVVVVVIVSEVVVVVVVIMSEVVVVVVAPSVDVTAVVVVVVASLVDVLVVGVVAVVVLVVDVDSVTLVADTAVMVRDFVVVTRIRFLRHLQARMRSLTGRLRIGFLVLVFSSAR